jgi:hypothetical protein
VAAVAAAVFGIGRLATAPSMALLYSGLDPAAAGEVVAALERQGIPFEVRDASIYVDGARRDQTRMALAAEGLPASGPTGYELLDGAHGLRHDEPDVRRSLLAREGGGARPHHHRDGERPLLAGAHREPVAPALPARRDGLGLGHRHHGPRQPRRDPGPGDPLSRVVGGGGPASPRRFR